MLHNISLPVCSGGWNARDPLNGMAPGDAIIYDNVIHENGKDRVRPGYELFVAAPADLLFSYNKKNHWRLLAMAGSVMTAYDAAANVMLTHDFGAGSQNQQATTFIDGAGNVHSILADGNLHVWDYTVSDAGVDSIKEAAFTGATNLSFPFSYKNRLWFIEPYSCNLYYGDLQAVQGELKKFFVGPYFKHGGYLIAMASWTQDGGDGMDDQLVLLSSEGEVLIYSGLSPTDDNWRLVGRYEIPKVFNAKSIAQIKGDLIMATPVGYIPLSSVLAELSASKVAISDKINGAVNGKSIIAPNWKIVYWANKGWIWVNAPTNENGLQYETHMFNLNNGTCSRLLGHDMRDMCVSDGNMYFTNPDGIFVVGGTTDNGAPIKWRIQPAYSDFGIKQRKKVMRATIHMSAISITDLYKFVWTDFDETLRTFVYNDAADTDGLAQWNTAEWNTAKWADIVSMHNIHAGIAHAPAFYISVGFWGSSTVETDMLGSDISLVIGKGVV